MITPLLLGAMLGLSPAVAAEPLERDALVAQVLARNPNLQAAEAAWQAAEARVPQARSLPDPRLELSAAPASLAPDARTGWGATVAQRLPVPGSLAFAAAAARAEAAAGRADLQAVQLELGLAAASAYDAWWEVHRAIEINLEHEALLGTLRDAAEAQYRVGNVTLQAPLQAEDELAHVEHERLVLEGQRRVIAARINGLLHAPIDAEVPPPADAPTPPEPGPPVERPELVAAELETEAAESRLRLARRQTLPDLTVMAGYSAMWMDPAHQWMVGVGLDIPIQLGRRAAEVDEAKALLARSEARAAATADDVAVEVQTARVRLEEALQVLRVFADRLVPIATERVGSARAGFEAGRDDFFVVIDAERNLRDAELGIVRARAAVATRTAELARALGQLPEDLAEGGAR